MVKTEVLNERLKRTYSDSGKMLNKIGTEEVYSEAVDLITATFEYEETDIEIEQEVEPLDEKEEKRGKGAFIL
ncbi:MAG TPA: hypothetical protein VFD25_05290 [Clostridia bacterium]|nr:hypothetical protein [Clostridia bacterium]